MHTLGKYLIELSLVRTELMAYRPSEVAAAALRTAQIILQHGHWVSFCYAAVRYQHIEVIASV